jgi:hypothetical protein
MAQTLIVMLLVAAAAGYMVWALMPARLRLRLGLPMRRGGPPMAGGSGSTCGCNGCEVAKPAARKASAEPPQGL